MFLLETLALDGHTASGCLRVPAESQGTENGMEPGPSGSIPDFAPLCSHLLHSNVPIRKHQGTKPGPEPGDRETFITKPFVWAWSWKSTRLPASSAPGCVCGSLPQSPLGTHCPQGPLLPVALPGHPALARGTPCLGTGARRLPRCSGGGWHGYCTQGTSSVMAIISPC